VPLFAYLLHRIIVSLDGTPTIIVLREAEALLEHPFFIPRLESLLEMLTQNNAMMLCTTSHPHAWSGLQSGGALLSACATRLYLPDDVPTEYAASETGLNPGDDAMLHAMNRQKGDLLLVQNGESVGLSIDLGGLDDTCAILTGDAKTLGVSGGRIIAAPRRDT